MNKLNSPVVILCLIIITLFNTVMSISTFMQNKKDNNMTDINIDSVNKDMCAESNILLNEDNIIFDIYDTKNIPIFDIPYNYSKTKEQNIEQIDFYISDYYPNYKVSCQSDECIISYNEDCFSDVYQTHNYDADISKIIIEQFRNQKELTTDMLINEQQTDAGEFIRSFNDLPTYIAVIRDIYNKHAICYYSIDGSMINYIDDILN